MATSILKVKALDDSIEGLSSKDRLWLLKTMLTSRYSDERESILYRQGRGYFHLPSAGHEAMAAVGAAFDPQHDWLYCYYRDKALLLAIGTPLETIALDFFAKANSSSGGRQMSSHFCDAERHIASYASPTGLQCLPAAGAAWSMKKNGSKGVVFCTTGEAATRQGEFYESVAFACEKSLPIIYVVEDNGYGISTPTQATTPLSLKIFKPYIREVDGRDPLEVYEATVKAKADVHSCGKPIILWVHLDRMMAHTSSDDHTLYRSADELSAMRVRDVLPRYDHRLKEDGVSQESIDALHETIKQQVKLSYETAMAAEDPDPTKIQTHLLSPSRVKATKQSCVTDVNGKNMAQAVNLALNTLLKERSQVVLFGEDIEDPKGGVFGLTKGLSKQFPGRVHNAPLAEATIAGIASGLSTGGYLPIIELQFIDFVGPAFNQIVNQIATLRWRTCGAMACPLILYAPCGGYITGGGPWHTQSNESWFIHTPGLKVYMPSNAHDTAAMFLAAASNEDPTIILLPKNQFRVTPPPAVVEPINVEHATILQAGTGATLISWGNCTEIAVKAAKQLEKYDLEIINLRSLAPCDWRTLHQSVRKTGRLFVIQEDAHSCSFGQAIISELMSDSETWSHLKAAPCLLSRDDVLIGFHPALSNASVPQVSDLVSVITHKMGAAS